MGDFLKNTLGLTLALPSIEIHTSDLRRGDRVCTEASSREAPAAREHRRYFSAAASHLGPRVDLSSFQPSSVRLFGTAMPLETNPIPASPERETADSLLRDTGFYIQIGAIPAARRHLRRIIDLWGTLPDTRQEELRPQFLLAKVWDKLLADDPDAAAFEVAQERRFNPGTEGLDNVERAVRGARAERDMKAVVRLINAGLVHELSRMEQDDAPRRAGEMRRELQPLIDRFQGEVSSGQRSLREAYRVLRAADPRVGRFILENGVGLGGTVDNIVDGRVGTVAEMEEQILANAEEFYSQNSFEAANYLTEGVAEGSYHRNRASQILSQRDTISANASIRRFLLDFTPSGSRYGFLRNLSMMVPYRLAGRAAAEAVSLAMPIIVGTTESSLTRGVAQYLVHSGTNAGALALLNQSARTTTSGGLLAQDFLHNMVLSTFLGPLGRVTTNPLASRLISIGGMAAFDGLTNPVLGNADPALLIVNSAVNDLLARSAHFEPTSRRIAGVQARRAFRVAGSAIRVDDLLSSRPAADSSGVRQRSPNLIEPAEGETNGPRSLNYGAFSCFVGGIFGTPGVSVRVSVEHGTLEIGVPSESRTAFTRQLRHRIQTHDLTVAEENYDSGEFIVTSPSGDRMRVQIGSTEGRPPIAPSALESLTPRSEEVTRPVRRVSVNQRVINDPVAPVTLGEHWEIAGEPVSDPTSGGAFYRVRPQSSALPNGEFRPGDTMAIASHEREGNIRQNFRRYPRAAEELGGVLHPDGSVTLPDRQAANHRLHRSPHNFGFRFFDSNGTAIVDDCLTGLAGIDPNSGGSESREPSNVIWVPYSRSGWQLLHDGGGVHALGYLGLPRRIVDSIRTRAQVLRSRLEEAHRTQDTPRVTALEAEANRFVGNFDGQTAMLSHIYRDGPSSTGYRERLTRNYERLLGIDSGTLSDQEVNQMIAEGESRLGPYAPGRSH